MGWTSSTGIIQHIHRTVLLFALSPEARLPSHTEIRKDKPMPRMRWHKKRSAQLFALWQVYLDNFDMLEIAEKDFLSEGSVSAELALAKVIYERLNIPMNVEKEENRRLQVDSLGTHVNGSRGVLETPKDAVLSLVAFSLFTLGLKE
eukprot:7143261-Karenia_brevis.AAC.1